MSVWQRRNMACTVHASAAWAWALRLSRSTPRADSASPWRAATPRKAEEGSERARRRARPQPWAHAPSRDVPGRKGRHWSSWGQDECQGMHGTEPTVPHELQR